MTPKSNKPCRICGHDEDACTTAELERRAKELVFYKKKASAAILQRDLKISYKKAAEMLDKLEEAGLIGASDGAKPRRVFRRKLKRWMKLGA